MKGVFKKIIVSAIIIAFPFFSCKKNENQVSEKYETLTIKREKAEKVPVKKVRRRKINLGIELNEEGIGKVTRETKFDIREIKKLFPRLLVKKEEGQTEESSFPIIKIYLYRTLLAEINNDGESEGIYNVRIKSNLIKNQLKHKIGDVFKKVYEKEEEYKCVPGADETSGKVLCVAPQSKHIVYLFNDMSREENDIEDEETVPERKVLDAMKIEEIIWIPGS